MRLNWLVAEAYGAAPDSYSEDCALRPGPHWLKITRTGNTLEAFRSTDGTTWTSWGAQTVNLPPKLMIGFFVSDGGSSAPATVTFDKVTLTGNLTAGDPPPPLPAALHRTVATAPAHRRLNDNDNRERHHQHLHDEQRDCRRRNRSSLDALPHHQRFRCPGVRAIRRRSGRRDRAW